MADKFSSLRKALVGALEPLLNGEAEKLRNAVENGELLSDRERANLLLNAGLIKQIRDDSSIRIVEIVYAATPEGVKVYQEIYKR